MGSLWERGPTIVLEQKFKKVNECPCEKGPFKKERIVFQTSVLWGELSVSGKGTGRSMVLSKWIMTPYMSRLFTSP